MSVSHFYYYAQIKTFRFFVEETNTFMIILQSETGSHDKYLNFKIQGVLF